MAWKIIQSFANRYWRWGKYLLNMWISVTRGVFWVRKCKHVPLNQVVWLSVNTRVCRMLSLPLHGMGDFFLFVLFTFSRWVQKPIFVDDVCVERQWLLLKVFLHSHLQFKKIVGVGIWHVCDKVVARPFVEWLSFHCVIVTSHIYPLLFWALAWEHW